MATAYLTQYNNYEIIQGCVVPVAALPEGTAITPITLSGSSQQFGALASTTRLVCLHSDGILSWASGSNPTAVTTQNRRPADFIEYFVVPQGAAGALKIAVIANT